MCAWQEFKYRMLLLRPADCEKNSSTLHPSVAPENKPAHKWTAFRISRSLLHSRIHVTYIVVNRYMNLTPKLSILFREFSYHRGTANKNTRWS
jgi:hypothetical protein